MRIRVCCKLLISHHMIAILLDAFPLDGATMANNAVSKCIGIFCIPYIGRYAGMPWLRCCLSSINLPYLHYLTQNCIDHKASDGDCISFNINPMQTKKEKILTQPFVEANYKNHRRKVAPPVLPHLTFNTMSLINEISICYLLCLICLLQVKSAQAVIDATCPPHQPHVSLKSKKLQKERERLAQIERENRRLLRKLSQIMITNRVENYWKNPHPKLVISL